MCLHEYKAYWCLSSPITVGGEPLREVESFVYLGSVVDHQGGTDRDVTARIGKARAAFVMLKNIWASGGISMRTKLRIFNSNVKSVLLYLADNTDDKAAVSPHFSYVNTVKEQTLKEEHRHWRWAVSCPESKRLTADIERRIQALEMRCFRKLLGISYRDHITNEEVKARIENAVGLYEDLLTSVKRRKLKWYGHDTRSPGLAKATLQGTVQGGRRRGRQRKRWEDNIKEWTGLE